MINLMACSVSGPAGVYLAIKRGCRDLSFVLSHLHSGMTVTELDG